MSNEDEQEVINKHFTEIEKNYFIHYLGGAYNFEKMKFLQKFMIKKITGETESKEIILDERIEELINFIN